MSDPETFLLEVYVVVDDVLAPLIAALPVRPGPPPALSPSEVVTLALMSQWARFRSGRDFYRYAEARLRPLFPTLPHRSQFLRQMLRWRPLIEQVALRLAEHLTDPPPPYEVLDSTAVPVRHRNRRGRGWLAGLVRVGASSRLHWYEGGHLLTCVSPTGVVTGYGIGPAPTNDRHLADTFFAARAAASTRAPSPVVLPSAGQPRTTTGTYLADMGFGGAAWEAAWATAYQVTLICPPQPDRRSRRWSREQRRWLTHHRQIVESVHARLLTAFRLGDLRPHSLAGWLTALAAIIALHNLTIWLNRQAGRPDLAVVGVLGW